MHWFSISERLIFEFLTYFPQKAQGLWTTCLSISPQISTVTVEDGRKDCRLEKQVDNDLHSGRLRLHWEKLKGFAGTAGGSENIFCDLFGVEAAEDTYWLDSSTRDQVCPVPLNVVLFRVHDL